MLPEGVRLLERAGSTSVVRAVTVTVGSDDSMSTPSPLATFPSGRAVRRSVMPLSTLMV